MRLRTYILALHAATLICSAAFAQGGMFVGGCGGASCAAAYQGPGDVFTSSPVAGYSCARVFTAALATTATNLCDLNAVTGGAAVCTLRASSTGKVDLSAYCPGSLTPAAACAAASGGSCVVSKVYDQVSTNHLVQGTLAVMPPIVFSSSPTGTLPVINCEGGVFILETAGTFSTAQPVTLSGVYIRATGTAAGGVFGETGSGNNYILAAAGANSASACSSSCLTDSGTADVSWHSIQGLLNGGSSASAINIDGSDTSGSVGTSAFSTALRVCRASGTQLAGKIAEAWMWGAATNATQRTNISNNQHSAGNGYNF